MSDTVLRIIGNGWREKKLVQFYHVEDHADVRESRMGRMDIYHVCRLAFLEDRFDKEVWKALTVPGSGPIETQGMLDDFNPKDDLSY
jgi:hypothetical protein